MGHIYLNLKPIPLPSDAHVNHYDNRVFQEYKDGNRRCKRTIGVLAKEGTMHVNENFRRRYPHLWSKYYGKIVPPMSQIRAGIYALTLGIITKTGLYPILIDAFGPQHANAILDYAMFEIRSRCNSSQFFPVEMEDQMLFSRKPWGDNAYSELFSKGITSDQIHAFRTAWLTNYGKATQGKEKKAEPKEKEEPKKVWLCVDGSNNDCAVKGSDLAAVGHAKSHRETSIVSFIWAVDAETGRPLTWFVNNGKTPDCKAVDEILKFLGSSNMKAEGVIMDRGFSAQQVLDLATAKGLKYIVMLKSDTTGFAEMLLRHSETVRWKMDFVVGNGEAMFGTTDRVRVFATDKHESCVGLYFTGTRSCSQITNLIRKVQSATRDMKQKIAAGAASLEVPADTAKFLNVVKDGDRAIDVKWNCAALQETADRYGFHAIASSENRSAEEIHNLYQLRDVSEKQFSSLKSQLGCDATRVHSDQAIESRYAVSFVAAVIRTEIELACRELELDTNVFLRMIDRIRMMRMTGGQYESIQDFPKDVIRLLKMFGIRPAHFNKFAEEVNSQEEKAIYDQYRTIPELELPRRGRRKGSRNKKTLEREAKLQEMIAAGEVVPEKPKRKRGRPAGRKNDKTLEREAKLKAAAEAGIAVETPPKRKRGRPAGKSRKTVELEAAEKVLKEKLRRNHKAKTKTQSLSDNSPTEKLSVPVPPDGNDQAVTEKGVEKTETADGGEGKSSQVEMLKGEAILKNT